MTTKMTVKMAILKDRIWIVFGDFLLFWSSPRGDTSHSEVLRGFWKQPGGITKALGGILEDLGCILVGF